MSQGSVDPLVEVVATKRTLAALSFAIERVAKNVGPDGVVIALFQRGAYFAPMLTTYEGLAECGLTVVVMYAGDGEKATGVTHVQIDDADPLAREWSLIVLAPTVAAYVTGTDLDELDLVGRTLEDRRRFQARWGFDRFGASEQARRVLDAGRHLIPVGAARQIDAAIAGAESVPTTKAEIALGRAALSLAASLEATNVALDDAKTRLDRESHHATRDPLTGLMNREGLQRWLGGSALDGVNMPLIGIVMIDLDGFKAVNDTHGHGVGDALLQAVADALTSCTRPSDVVARMGGDEFVVLCPGTEVDELTHIAARMVDAVATTAIGDVQVGASAGVQTSRYRPLPLAAADEAMYAAKRAGGGRVVSIDATAA